MLMEKIYRGGFDLNFLRVSPPAVEESRVARILRAVPRHS